MMPCPNAWIAGDSILWQTPFTASIGIPKRVTPCTTLYMSIAAHLQLRAALSQEMVCILSSVAVPAGLIQLCRELQILLAQRGAVCALGCQLGSQALGLGTLVCPLRPQLPALVPQPHELSMLLQISNTPLHTF